MSAAKRKRAGRTASRDLDANDDYTPAKRARTPKATPRRASTKQPITPSTRSKTRTPPATATKPTTVLPIPVMEPDSSADDELLLLGPSELCRSVPRASKRKRRRLSRSVDETYRSGSVAATIRKVRWGEMGLKEEEDEVQDTFAYKRAKVLEEEDSARPGSLEREENNAMEGDFSFAAVEDSVRWDGDTLPDIQQDDLPVQEVEEPPVYNFTNDVAEEPSSDEEQTYQPEIPARQGSRSASPARSPSMPPPLVEHVEQQYMIASTSKQTIEYQQEQQEAFESYSRFSPRQTQSKARSPSHIVQEPEEAVLQIEQLPDDQPQFDDALDGSEEVDMQQDTLEEQDSIVQEPDQPTLSDLGSPVVEHNSPTIELHIEAHRPLSPQQPKLSKSPSIPLRKSPSVELRPEAHRPFSPENLAVPSPRFTRSRSPQLDIPLRSARTPSIEPLDHPSSIEVPLTHKSTRRSPIPFLARLTSAPPDSPAALEPPSKVPRLSLSPSPMIRSALSPSPAIVQRSVSPYANVKQALALEKGKSAERRPVNLFPDTQAHRTSVSPQPASPRPSNLAAAQLASPIPVNLFPSTQARSPVQHSPAFIQRSPSPQPEPLSVNLFPSRQSPSRSPVPPRAITPESEAPAFGAEKLPSHLTSPFKSPRKSAGELQAMLASIRSPAARSPAINGLFGNTMPLTLENNFRPTSLAAETVTSAQVMLEDNFRPTSSPIVSSPPSPLAADEPVVEDESPSRSADHIATPSSSSPMSPAVLRTAEQVSPQRNQPAPKASLYSPFKLRGTPEPNNVVPASRYVSTPRAEASPRSVAPSPQRSRIDSPAQPEIPHSPAPITPPTRFSFASIGDISGGSNSTAGSDIGTPENGSLSRSTRQLLYDIASSPSAELMSSPQSSVNLNLAHLRMQSSIRADRVQPRSPLSQESVKDRRKFANHESPSDRRSRLSSDQEVSLHDPDASEKEVYARSSLKMREGTPVHAGRNASEASPSPTVSRRASAEEPMSDQPEREEELDDDLQSDEAQGNSSTLHDEIISAELANLSDSGSPGLPHHHQSRSISESPAARPAQVEASPIASTSKVPMNTTPEKPNSHPPRLLAASPRVLDREWTKAALPPGTVAARTKAFEDTIAASESSSPTSLSRVSPRTSALEVSKPPRKSRSHSRSMDLTHSFEHSRTHSDSLIEIRSSDPRAAARVAAILKVHHDFVPDETGKLVHRKTRQRAESPMLEGLLREAEASVLLEGDDTAASRSRRSHSPHVPHQHRHVRHHSASASLAIPERSERDDNSWTKADWRRLESTLKDAQRRAYEQEEDEPSVYAVVREFMEDENLTEADLKGHWSKQKLEFRVQALLQTRCAPRMLAFLDSPMGSPAPSHHSRASSVAFSAYDAQEGKK